MPVENWVAREIEPLTAFRRDLHENPELLYEVTRTAGRVAEALRAAGVDEVIEGIGKTGVVGVIKGRSTGSGRMIGLRADMDALPIHEESGKPWASKVPGKMHACGHDGHTAMLLGAAKHLAEARNFDGTVIVIFQPAEEGGAGARAMIEDGLFQRWPCQEIYGMHNHPNLPIGQFSMAAGPIMGSVDVIDIRISGTGGHAARPHEANDPLPIAAALIQGIQTLTARTLDPMDRAVISVTTIHAGDVFNVIPEDVKLTGTVRTMREEVRDHIETRLGQMVTHISSAFDATGTLGYDRLYPVTVNHEREILLAAEAARAVAGEDNVSLTQPPTLGGEDFSFMLNEVPGAFISVGNGPSHSVHHPKYDFNDEAIPWGCSYWTTLVRQRLPLA